MMTEAPCIGSFFVLFAVAAAPPLAHAQVSTAQRPNVVLIITDDGQTMREMASSTAMARRTSRPPNIDGPARDGVRVWEGGIRVPAIFRWPGRIPPGGVSGQVGITMDLTASILAATGTPVPGDLRTWNPAWSRAGPSAA